MSRSRRRRRHRRCSFSTTQTIRVGARTRTGSLPPCSPRIFCSGAFCSLPARAPWSSGTSRVPSASGEAFRSRRLPCSRSWSFASGGAFGARLTLSPLDCENVDAARREPQRLAEQGGRRDRSHRAEYARKHRHRELVEVPDHIVHREHLFSLGCLNVIEAGILK